MHGHVSALLGAAERVVKGEGTARDKLTAITHAFIALYVGAAARHKVLLNELNNLPPDRRAEVVRIQRKLIAIVEKLIGAIAPSLAGSNPLARPAAMLYFGMINWTHTWLNPGGRVEPERIAALAVEIFLDGIARAK
jgi:hypothetical protein